MKTNTVTPEEKFDKETDDNSLTMLLIGFRHHILAIRRGEGIGRLCDNEKKLAYFNYVINTSLFRINALGEILSLAERGCQPDDDRKFNGAFKLKYASKKIWSFHS